MKKIINPCVCETGYGMAQAYVKIEYENKKLSICGVVGPMKNGNCKGSAGQCIDSIRNGKPVEGWDDEMLKKLCDIWDEWHLNDMRPYCEHMKALGWNEQAKEKVKVAKWKIKREVMNMKRDAESRAIKCLKNGECFVPTPEETMYANLRYEVKTYNDEAVDSQEFYEFKEVDCLGRSNVEYKTRGWIRCTEHELGFLKRKCPVCGYEYGTSWLIEEVPADVIEWLFNLPYTKKTPAWI